MRVSTAIALLYCVLLTVYVASAKRQKAEPLAGVASWYGEAYRGKPTASGQPYDPDALSAAHRTLPFGTKVRCSYGGKSVVVTINDRGPFIEGRVIDLSQHAFSQLAHTDAGLINIQYEIIE